MTSIVPCCRVMYSLACAFLIAAGLANAQSTKPAIQTPSAPKQAAKAASDAAPSTLIDAGNTLYQQNCAFCHGRDAGGGETGPDLTRSKVVGDDKGGDKIGVVVLNGRIEQGMPKFNFPGEQIAALSAFLHKQKVAADLNKGGRRGVDVEDLQTGNAEAGKQYFNGAGNCASCHSPSGDLAHIAARRRGLNLEERLLYPKDSPIKATVTTPDGKSISGQLAYQDEFTVALHDEGGRYRSWPVSKVKLAVDDPAQAHADLLAKYTDNDIHNLMAYLQTLK